MAEVVEYNRAEDLESLREDWAPLLAQTQGATFFQSLDWLQARSRWLGDESRMRVLAVYAGGGLVGILPLSISVEQSRLGSLRVLGFPLNDFSPFYGPIGPNPTATMVAGLRYIRRTPQDWDCIDLCGVNVQQHDHGRTRRSMKNARLEPIESDWHTTAILEISGTWEDYMATRSRNFRQQVRKKTRRMEKSGELEYSRFRPGGAAVGDADPNWNLYNECVDLSRRAWQGSSTTGITLSHDSVAGFFRVTHELAVDNGMLDINVLRRDGEMIAYLYSYIVGGNILMFKTAYAPEVADMSPGIVLYAKAFEDSFARGDLSLDFGQDVLEIKTRWATRLVQGRRYTYYSSQDWRKHLFTLRRYWSNYRRRHREEAA